jgi:exonuclease III
VIFLSDIMANSLKQVAATLDITKRLSFRGYTFIHNSMGNSRGVGLLLSNKLKFTIHDEFRDPNGNILLLNISIQGARITIGSIYSPNNDDQNFFTTISDICLHYGNRLIVIGGDWNTTVDNRPARSNIYTLNMVNIPSKNRSKWLKEMCNVLKLSDPYRHFYPDRLEYTYIPNAVANTNRSRLDFFVISDTPLPE